MIKSAVLSVDLNLKRILEDILDLRCEFRKASLVICDNVGLLKVRAIDFDHLG